MSVCVEGEFTFLGKVLRTKDKLSLEKVKL